MHNESCGSKIENLTFFFRQIIRGSTANIISSLVVVVVVVVNISEIV
ncbi:MAG TPA: hypothetical protein VN239_01920 [Nitrososphaera sp.]|nr:hypothetical protein [Nitrososphaera sp.]